MDDKDKRFWVRCGIPVVLVVLVILLVASCSVMKIQEKKQSDMAKKLEFKVAEMRRTINLSRSAQAINAPPLVAPDTKRYTYTINDPISMCTLEEQSKWQFKIRANSDPNVSVKLWPVIALIPATDTEFIIYATNAQMFFHSTIINTNGLWEFETGSRKPF